MKREMVCISCPVGCRLTVTWEDDPSTIDVKGNRCARGEEYGREEILAPTRMVTATVRLRAARIPRLPVRTVKPVRKERIRELLSDLYRIEVTAPVRLGAAVIEDWQGTGIDVVATRSMASSEGPDRADR